MTGIDQPLGFQRARSPEQREARRRAILDVAAQLLGEMPVSEISLRELARRVGLSKTNVVRYFETREAVFFALLNRSIADWLDDLPASLPPSTTAPASASAGVVATASGGVATTASGGVVSPVEAVAVALARSLAQRPLVCELWSALGTELERNISAEAVRSFKLEHASLQDRLASLLAERIPALSHRPGAARELVAMMILLVAGLWPFANPAPAVAEAVQDPALAHSRVNFPDRLGRALTVAITGLAALPAEPA
ncbi:TetR/AcrR family transcriptional regulator [Actinoplanes sp. LDG1-06]|uniref:TetR/AcrR family transcriptional regulator n=1 Tax=Paractinoplanes ovalisporus TaxID=2810368 RepID=A0ABS2AIC6_9ACTN|nr:TetR/AcrR family transcriptional regulator [Actinoplanes ovalisporus]MBM2618966.1 TetR/AcrR family transcriptional regulator [Actinoplanes ovalisporus]